MGSTSPLYSVLHLIARDSVDENATAPSNVTGDWRAAAKDHPEDLLLEGWSQGFMVGALMVMGCVTVANMRKGVLLHKLILLEQMSALSHGTFCFMSFKGYGWYLSGTAALLYLSWIVHNSVAWMKVRPFFTHPRPFFKPKVGRRVMVVYLTTLAMTVPVILFQISDNFRFFNNRGGWYTMVRPYEPLFRDPWWVFTCITLFHVIRKCYGTGVIGLIKRSPRFGIMLTAIIFSIIFTVVDIIASIHSFVGKTDGINPWWKLSLVFKCLTDTIMLDDFKTELKRLGIRRMEKEEARRNSEFAVMGEYPGSRKGSDASDYLQSRRDTFWKNPFGKTFSSVSTAVVTPKDSQEDNSKDPFFPNTPPKTSVMQEKNSGTSPPTAVHEDIDFATALSLGASRKAAADNTDRSKQSEEKELHRTGTKKLGMLPQLKEFTFEAIKPGKRGNDDRDLERGSRLRNDSTTSMDDEDKRLSKFRASIGAAE